MNHYNTAEPKVMHIDLNSCFATVEQQARPCLRNKPVAISNRTSINSCIITASYEAKALGVKVGMRRIEALKICPDLIFVESEPAKYRYVYHKLLNIMNDYSPDVQMKSIDEGVMDFKTCTELLKDKNLAEIGTEIKQRLKNEVGCWMRCNIGISTNRFLAKTAAGLHKPDGMDVITHENLREVLSGMKLRDLTGIAHANEKRLILGGINTPLEFLDADEELLKKVVFKSICGSQWHARLRGFEVDNHTSDIKSVGRQYVLEDNDLTRGEIEQRLFHLCEDVGARLRQKNRVARGVQVYVRTYSHKYWHTCHKFAMPFFTDQAIWQAARWLFVKAPDDIREIGVTCYGIEHSTNNQLSIFQDSIAQEESIQNAIDKINNRFGARTIHVAETLPTRMVKTKVPFGSTRYI